MDIIRERLEREYNLDLVVTNPSTDYQVTMTTGEQIDIKSASDLPDVTKISRYVNHGLMARLSYQVNILEQ